MIAEDLLVAFVSATLGLALLLVAVFNWDWFYDLPKARWLARSVGRRGVRLIYALLGALLIGLAAVLWLE